MDQQFASVDAGRMRHTLRAEIIPRQDVHADRIRLVQHHAHIVPRGIHLVPGAQRAGPAVAEQPGEQHAGHPCRAGPHQRLDAGIVDLVGMVDNIDANFRAS